MSEFSVPEVPHLPPKIEVVDFARVHPLATIAVASAAGLVGLIAGTTLGNLYRNHLDTLMPKFGDGVVEVPNL